MIVLRATNATDTVLTFAERPMVPCRRRWPDGCGGGCDDCEGSGEIPLAPGDRLAVAVPCPTCKGRERFVCDACGAIADSVHCGNCGGFGTACLVPCDKCKDLGSLIVASAVVEYVAPPLFSGYWRVGLTDVRPTTERCPACWNAGNEFCRQCHGERGDPVPIPVRTTPGISEWSPT